MEVSVDDYEGKKIVAEVNHEGLIAITETYGETQIILDLMVARRLGSALKLLAKMAMDEEVERAKALDNHE